MTDRSVGFLDRMSAGIAPTLRFGRAVAVRAQAVDVTFLAAAVAYYAFLSLLPALLLILAIGTAIGSDALANALVAAANDLLTLEGETLIRDTLADATGRTGATLVGLAVLLWSMLRVFRALSIAFQRVYGVQQFVSLGTQIRDGVVAAFGVGVGIVAMIVVGAVIGALNLDPLLEALGVAVLPLVLTVVFLPLYYVFPHVDNTVAEVLPGALFAALGWTLLQAVFQLYAAYAGQYQTYGVLGGVLLTVMWFYVGAIVLLLGAVLNAILYEWSDGDGDRQLQHAAEPQTNTTPMVSDDTTRDESAHTDPDRRVSTGRGSPRPDGGDREHSRHTGQFSSNDVDPAGAPDIAELQREVDRLRTQLEEFETDVEARTVERPKLKADLKRYVRWQMRRGHARGWGPYLVLLYGTVLTLGAFAWLDGIYAIAAMIILGLSTLGLYVLFVLFGIGLNIMDVPFRAIDAYRRRD